MGALFAMRNERSVYSRSWTRASGQYVRGWLKEGDELNEKLQTKLEMRVRSSSAGQRNN